MNLLEKNLRTQKLHQKSQKMGLLDRSLKRLGKRKVRANSVGPIESVRPTKSILALKSLRPKEFKTALRVD